MARGIPNKDKPKKQELRETTRLSYTTSEGSITSSRVLLGSTLVVVLIDKKNLVYRIVDANEPKFCFALGKGNNTDECKKNARKKLMECNATIFEEARMKK